MAQYFVMLLSSFPFLLLVLLVFSFFWPFVVVHFIFATFEFANFGEERNENWIGLRNTKAKKKTGRHTKPFREVRAGNVKSFMTSISTFDQIL